MPGYGPHLMVDGDGCDKERLTDLNLLYRVLEELPGRIGMTKIIPPYVFKYTGLKPEDWGLSGFVLIAESHISIHTHPEKSSVSVDIFSCKSFDTEFATEYLRSTFAMDSVEVQVVDRGTEFPKELGASASVVRAQRRRVGRQAASKA